ERRRKLPRQTSWPIPKGTSLTTGRVLRRPQRQYGAASVAEFLTAAYRMKQEVKKVALAMWL
ncbi:MAG: hypothetical protein ACK5X0_23210, partial [Rhodospirillales bacterium]